jgi:hypothetical protein
VLQGADLDPWRDLVESFHRNRPARVPQSKMQLAFAQVITELSTSAANDALASAPTARSRSVARHVTHAAARSLADAIRTAAGRSRRAQFR